MSASIKQIWNIVASQPKFIFTSTLIFCSPICSNSCGVVFFCENIFKFSRNDSFCSTAQIWTLNTKTKMYFHKKKNTTIIRTYWATKYESRSERKFWVTCHRLSDACWHKLLSVINHSENFLWTIIYTGLPHKRQKSDE